MDQVDQSVQSVHRGPSEAWTVFSGRFAQAFCCFCLRSMRSIGSDFSGARPKEGPKDATVDRRAQERKGHTLAPPSGLRPRLRVSLPWLAPRAVLQPLRGLRLPGREVSRSGSRPHSVPFLEPSPTRKGRPNALTLEPPAAGRIGLAGSGITSSNVVEKQSAEKINRTWHISMLLRVRQELYSAKQGRKHWPF